MKKVLLIILLGLSIVTTSSCHSKKFNLSKTEGSLTMKGKTISDFSCDLKNGKKYNLYNRNGKVPVFVTFWAAWDDSAIKELNTLQKIYNMYKLTVDFVFINYGESKEVVDDFIAKNHYDFPVGYDINNEISRKFKVTGIPTSFIINNENVISEVIVGARKEDEYEEYLKNIFR